MTTAPTGPSYRWGQILTPRHWRIWLVAALSALVAVVALASTTGGARLLASFTDQVDAPIVELSTRTTGADLADCPCNLRFTVRNSGQESITTPIVATAVDGGGDVLLTWETDVILAPGAAREVWVPWAKMPTGWAGVSIALDDRPQQVVIRRPEAAS